MPILNAFKNDSQKTPNKTEKQEVKIIEKPYQQGEVSPSKTVFNLNDYCRKGYTDDSQNGEAAKEIRHDILSRYDIDEDDSDKEKKLVKIYLDILDDAKNSVLRDNLGEKAYYDGTNDDEFIEDVEGMMAHMVHDGTGQGDEITLSEVDFSDIEYSNEPKTGSIEARTLDNGVEYTVYDENDKVIKFISKTVDENGLTTISTYSDADKKELISQEQAFEFPKTDDEIKFKFAGGNQNTVNFKDEGNSVEVEISKGAVREAYTLDKNSDGTYSLNGKQFYTIEEAAVYFNNQELQLTEELDRTLSATKQGKTGDCALLSALNSLNSTEFGRNILKDAISIDSEGNATVNFKGLGKKYTVTLQELKKASNYSTGDIESRVFEIAWGKMLTDNNLKNNYDVITGTTAGSVFKALTGVKSYGLHSYGESYRLDGLDKLENDGSMAITVGNQTVNMATSQATSSKEYQNAYGNAVKIYDGHSYAVKESDTLPNGKRIVTVINPYDSSQEIVLDEDTFLQAFAGTDDIELDK